LIEKPGTFLFKAMGGPCRLTLITDKSGQATQVCREIEQEVRRLESKYSRFRSDSLLSRMNRGELNGVPLDKETQGILNYIRQVYESSEGLFDPTVGVLREAWDFSSQQIPDREQIDILKHRLGWQKVKWDGTAVQMPENMALDLGGVVKEFAADRAKAILQKNGISGLINLAGDIVVSGSPENSQNWSVAVRHPRRSGAFATIQVGQGAIAGSGDYERYVEYQGRRYCHILRPDTGFPATDGLVSVTVLANNCLLAGTISTVAMLKGADGVNWLNEMGMPYLAIDQQLKPYGSIEVIE
jgi:FAD:protein FMN transferase